MTITNNTAPTEAIDRIQVETLHVPIVGMSPLIVHRFSEKAKRQMLDNMQGRKSVKEPKDPHADYESCFYRLKGGRYGFPVDGLKLATVGGARFYGKSVTMTALRQQLFFTGEPGEDGQQLVEITGEPEMREDVVRVGQGTDLRYRPMFREWSALVTVTFVTSSITRGSVLSLIEAGGLGVGIGEWRPERRGSFGTFRIDPDRDVVVDGQQA